MHVRASGSEGNTHIYTHTPRCPVNKSEAVSSQMSDPEGISCAERYRHCIEYRPGSHQVQEKAPREPMGKKLNFLSVQ